MNKTIYPLILAALATACVNAPSQAQEAGDGGININVSGGIPGLPSFLGGPAYGSTSILPTTVGGARPTVEQGAINGVAASPNAGGPAGSSFSGGTTGIFGNTSAVTGGGPMGMGGLTSAPTSQHNLGLPQASQNLMAPGSVDMSGLPSGQWKYGFPNEATAPFMGVSHGSVGGFLPPTSTSSVDFNTVDCPFIRGPLGGGSGSGLGNINFNIPLPGGVNVGGSINTQQAVNSLQNFFGN